MAITTATVGAPLDNARRDLSDATEAMAAYWGAMDSDTDAQLPDVARCRGSDHSRYVLTDAGRPAQAMAALFDPGPILADVIATPWGSQ